MPEYENVKISLDVDDTPLEEFRVSTSILSPLHRRVECTIPSEAGKNFVIRVADGNDWLSIQKNVHSRITIFLDGKQCRSVVNPGWKGDNFIREALTDRSTYRLLKFVAIQLADLDDKVPDEEDYRELGTIRVEVCYIRKDGLSTSASTSSSSAILDKGPLSEKSKKAGGNRSALGDHVAVKNSSFDCTKLEHLPTTDFVFTHAPRLWLQAQEIVPRDPQPEPVDEPVKPTPPPNNKRKRLEGGIQAKEEYEVQFLSNEEAEVYRQLKRKINTEMKKVKSEVKNEPPLVSLSRNSQKTVIDLTLD